MGMIAVIATLRYDDAIVLPVKEKDSANLLFLSLIFNFLINSFLFISILLLKDQITRFINLPAGFPTSIIYFIPAGAFLLNTFQSFNYWLIRKKKYKNVSVNKLIRRGSEGGAQISFALIKNQIGLIFSDIIGQLANVTAIIVQSFKNGFRFQMISISKLKYVSKKYSEFPKFNLIPAFMSSYCFLLPPILIIKFFSAENAGYFDTSKLVLSLPLALVASSVNSVLLQRTSEQFNNRKSLVGDLRPIFYIISLICIIELFVISFFGPFLFRFVFGNTWNISGEISRILVWSFTLNFFVSSFTSLFYSMHKIKIFSIWQFFYFMAVISLIFFKNLGFLNFLKIYVVIETTCYFILAVLMFNLIRQYEKSIKSVSV